MKEGMDQNYW